ncbi:MAG: AAA family ATPase [Egibacteraceae bacterium]
MPRRLTSLLPSLLLVLLLVLVDVVANLISGGSARPWSMPLLVGIVVLLVAVTVWQYLVEHPGIPKRVWTAERPPYPGLEAFTEQDAAVFFGREPQITELVDRLHPTLPRNAHQFVAVVGPSGAGKSSLVQAGLLPRLAGRRGRWVIVPPLLPGDHPTRSLADSLGVPEADLAEALRAAGDGRASVLLVIDQAEELLTLTGPKERDAFLELLRRAMEQDPRLWVVATLRSEFLTSFLETDFADLFHQPVTIGALDRAALSAVIEGPAEQAGLGFAPRLVQRMVDDTGGGDALPLLAYTLQALYLRVGSGGTVTEEDYRQLGGVAGTLSRQADKVTAELRAIDADVPVVDTLLRFVTLDGTDPTRRRVQRSTLGDAEQAVVDAFIAARLLTSDDATVQVAHEALFRRWAPLAQAIEARADELRQRAELERWAVDWDRSGRRGSYLLQGERLATAQQWAATHNELVVDLPLVRELLDRSTRADYAALERLSEALAGQALAEVDQDPEHSLVLALAAMEECAPTLLAQRALLAALAASHVRAVLHGHEDSVYGVAWSPDGKCLATASRDGTARVWEADSGEKLLVLRGHEDVVQRVAWSPDGECLATTSNDRTARVWDAVRGDELLVLRGHDDWVWGVVWSPDGKHLATTSEDHTVRVWDAACGAELFAVHGHEDAVWGVVWSPDGQRLATASRDGTARVWDAAYGRELLVLRGHHDWVQGVAWSPDGQRLATVSHDRTARVWDATCGEERLVLRGHEDSVWGVAWSPDGQRLATTSGDHTARVWDVVHGRALFVLHGHHDSVYGAAWSPDSQRLATVSRDRTSRVWDAALGEERLVLRDHEDWIYGVAWSPDGQRLATASRDGTVRVWDAALGEELLVLRGHEAGLMGVAWSSDSKRLATASRDGSARIWDAKGGTQLASPCMHSDWVTSVAWSPDGKRVITASRDGTARIWDVATDLDALVAKARTRVFHQLTDDERRKLMLPERV